MHEQAELSATPEASFETSPSPPNWIQRRRAVLLSFCGGHLPRHRRALLRAEGRNDGRALSLGER